MKIRFEKREKQTALRTFIVTLVCVLLSLVFCGIVIAASGCNPIEVYAEMFSNSFLSPMGIQNMLKSCLPFLFCGLAVALAFKMNLNNIGAEGQYAVGLIAGGAYVMYGPGIEGPIGWILLALCCFIGGAVWSLLSAIPKALWNVNESITTLMMNYVALTVLDFLCLGPWKMQSQNQNVAQTERIPEGLELPSIVIGDFKISYGIIFGIIIAIILFVVYKYTAPGYRISVIGKNPTAAKYAGINIKKTILTVMAISGGIAGLAGYVKYSGVFPYRIAEGITNNAGYMAIVIAFLSRLNPIAIVIVSMLFAGLQNGTVYVQAMGVSSRLPGMMQGAMMLFVIAGEFFIRYKPIITRREKS